MKVSWSPKQKSILEWIAQHDPLQIILEGAVRSGKTWLNNFLWALHVRSFSGQNKDFIITGHTTGSIERNVVSSLNKMLGFNIKLDIRNRFRLYGNTCHCFGADKYDSYKSMTGMTSYGWYANEVNLQHFNSIQEAFDRCSGDGFRIFWDCNPDYPDHQVKLNYIDKSGMKLEDGRIRLKSWHFTIEDNPFLTKTYVENLKATTPKGMWYDRKIKGLWVAAEGIVYENWNRDIHVIKPFKIPEHWERYRVIDWGFTNPFVCLWGALDEDGRLYIYKEHYRAQTLIKDHAAIINGFKEYKTVQIFDEEKKKEIEYNCTIADHDAQDNAELAQYDIYTKNANKDVSVGIQKVAERLVVQGDGKPRLFVFDTCVNTIREVGKYRWQEVKDGKPVKEEPLKIDDHCCDGLRYLCMEIDFGLTGGVSEISASSLGL